MSKPGRNDLCSCGSGIKYKNCCLKKNENNVSFNEWREKAYSILQNSPHSKEIVDIFFEVLEFMNIAQWQGACHATTSLLYILLNEIGINADPCIGEADIDGEVFDHSWITIDNQIYDIAIYLPMDMDYQQAPIIKGISLQTGAPTKLKYGINSNKGLGMFASIANEQTIIEYLDNSLSAGIDLWSILQVIAKKLNFTLDLQKIRHKYKNISWLKI